MTLPLVPAPMFGGGTNILYLGNAAIPYSPASIRVTWTNPTVASPITTKLCVVPTGANALKSWTESVPDRGTFHTDRLFRAGSAALLSNVTISGTLDFCLAAWGTDINSKIYFSLFVTAGATDTLRGTLLSNWLDSANLGTTAQGELRTGLSLSSVAAQAGDYLIWEWGVRFSDSSGGDTENTRYGGTDAVPLGGGDTNVTTRSGWIKFNSISLDVAS